MGAHSLGGALKRNSGYSGRWTPDSEDVFDNNFYQRLDENIWTHINKVGFHKIF